ncbi:hypothetical protein GCM10009733_098340 [Nonomuraea maheshkhaliensis]|uniref:Uncharacterized protein n=1 Tax=Nonomuraea maheshkhaliensis TaxID=419590 RepID=A0ABN2HDC3_9ACTN
MSRFHSEFVELRLVCRIVSPGCLDCLSPHSFAPGSSGFPDLLPYPAQGGDELFPKIPLEQGPSASEFMGS